MSFDRQAQRFEGDSPVEVACCGALRPNSPYDQGLEYGSAETDLRHRATTALLYELPSMPGNRGEAISFVLPDIPPALRERQPLP